MDPSTPASQVASGGNHDAWSSFSSQQTPHTTAAAPGAASGMMNEGGPKLLEGYLRLRGRHTYDAPVETAQETIQTENPRQWMKTWCVLTKDSFRWGPASTAAESSQNEEEEEENHEHTDEAALEFLSSGLSSRGLIRCQSIETLLEAREHRMFILVCRMGAVILQVSYYGTNESSSPYIRMPFVFSVLDNARLSYGVELSTYPYRGELVNRILINYTRNQHVSLTEVVKSPKKTIRMSFQNIAFKSLLRERLVKRRSNRLWSMNSGIPLRCVH